MAADDKKTYIFPDVDGIDYEWELVASGKVNYSEPNFIKELKKLLKNESMKENENMKQCFKIKNGTNYDVEIKRHFDQRPKWKNVMNKVGEMLEENITELALKRDELWINTYQLTKEENKKLFTKDGKLKGNTKKAKEFGEKYKQILSEEDLTDFEELRVINFIYGVMRMHGEELSSFVTSEHDIYYKADFNLEDRSKGLVVPISEIEYEEKYLEELKKEQ